MSLSRMKFSFDSIMLELNLIMDKIIIKRTMEARKYEKSEKRSEVDRYFSARNKISNYYTYTKFDDEVYLALGIPAYQIPLIDKKALKRLGVIDKAIELQDKITLATYNEHNNYYRRINGLPDIEDTEYIFAPMEFYEENNIDIKPVHEFTLKEYNRLKKSIYFDETITNNINNSYMLSDGETKVSREYLKYLGENKIDIIQAREAKNFEILYMDISGLNQYLFEEFLKTYNKVRDYYMLSIYNDKFNDIYTEYDTFLGVLIMYRTIETLIVNTLKFSVDRNYFDLRTMKLVYDAYGVPFDENISLEYHRYLLRNINYLLHNKASDRCLREIFNIFGRGDMSLYRYYLVKRHKKIDDKPLFVYKKDLKGNTILDKEKMYELYFQLVDSRVTNISAALRENYIQESYESVIVNDPYWVDDDITRDKLYNLDYNYIETKYLGVVIMRQMTELIFETQYAIRILIDNKEEIEKIKVSVSTLTEDITLFECVITLCALLAKKLGFAGNIISDPTQVYNIYGFNVKADVQQIIDDILNSKYCTDEVKDILIDLKINDKKDVDTLYKNIMAFRKIIVQRRYECDSIQEFRLYDRAYRVLMTTDESDLLFTKSDGTVAKTYLEYIRDTNPELAESIDEVKTSEEIMTFADSFIEAILYIIDDLNLVFELNDGDDDIVSCIIKLAMFFKSYTTDIIKLNSNLNINDLNERVKMTGDIDNLEVELTLKSVLKGSFDTISTDVDLNINQHHLLREKIEIE